jgi:uncharacterized protein YdeI (YjbR/CyaY-like superfamily)
LDETLEFESDSQWEKWLEKNHTKSKGIWIRLFKKDSGIQTVTISQAVDVALCYGWITGQIRKYDEKSWLSRFVPRRPKSIWSKINVQHANRLIREGRMKPAGLRQIEDAKRDGRWARAYNPPSTAKLPDDFVRELRKNPKAEAYFMTLNKANVYALIFRLENTRSEERRMAKIKEFVNMFERGEKFH